MIYIIYPNLKLLPYAKSKVFKMPQVEEKTFTISIYPKNNNNNSN